MNNNHFPPLPPPNATLIRPQIVQRIPPPTLQTHTPMYRYQPQILHNSQSFAYPQQYPHHQQIPTPQQQFIPHHQSYPSFTHNNKHHNSSSNTTNSHTNHTNKRKQNSIIQLGDFCIDKTPSKYNNRHHSTPHYKVFNEIPLPFPSSNVAKSLRNCFNCGANHFVRDCKQNRDNHCIQFNRHLKDKYDGNKNKKSFFDKKKGFRNQRYFDTNSLNEHKLSRNVSSSSNSSSSIQISSWNKKGNTEESFDEYLKNVQNDGEISDKQLPKLEVEEEEEEEEKIGFKFDEEIECLMIFKTKEEIEQAQVEYKKQMENDEKEIENNWKRNKYERNNNKYGNTSTSDDSVQIITPENYTSTDKNNKNNKNNPNDIDRRKLRQNNRRNYRDYTGSENGDRDYRKRVNQNRNYTDRDRDRDRHYRSRSRYERRDRSKSNDRKYRSTNRDRDRDRARDRNRDRYTANTSHKSSPSPIDYGFGLKKKGEKIKKCINERYGDNDKDDIDRYKRDDRHDKYHGKNERYHRDSDRDRNQSKNRYRFC